MAALCNLSRVLQLQQRAAAAHSKIAARTHACPRVVLGYLNYRGERSDRVLFPQRVWFGKTAWHPTPQWFLRAHDANKQQTRDSAVADIYAAQKGGKRRPQPHVPVAE